MIATKGNSIVRKKGEHCVNIKIKMYLSSLDYTDICMVPCSTGKRKS